MYFFLFKNTFFVGELQLVVTVSNKFFEWFENFGQSTDSKICVIPPKLF